MSKVMEISFASEEDYNLVLEKITEMDEEEEFVDVLAVRDVTE